MTRFLIICFLLISSISFAGNMNLEKQLVLGQMDSIKKGENVLDRKFYIISGLSIVAVFAADEKINEWALHYPEKGAYEKTRDLFNEFGTKKILLIPAAGYIAGLAIKDDKLKAASFTSAESVFFASCLTFTLKAVVGRSRPDEYRGGYTFKPFNLNDDWNSMPSGHSTAAWALATPFAVYYDNNWIYLIPAGVSVARVVSERHWASDVIAGGIIGFATGYTLAKSGMKNVEFTGNGIKVKF